MSKTSINISSQNLTLAAAQNSVENNPNGYFQVVSFYLAKEGGDSTCANSTGFVVEFDERLTVLDYGIGRPFRTKLRNSAGQVITNSGRGVLEQKALGDNKFFLASASSEEITEDGYLAFAGVQFPADVAIEDVFTITIDTDEEFICESSFDDDETRAADTAFAKTHIINGRITIIE